MKVRQPCRDYIGYENEGMIVAFSIQVIALRLDIKINYLALMFKILMLAKKYWNLAFMEMSISIDNFVKKNI